MKRKKRDSLMIIIFAVAAFAVTFSVYYLTSFRGVAAGDSTEMVTAAYTLGIAHQPGYPLNNIIGYLFKNLPIPVGEVMRINMASAFLQSLGVSLFFLLMLELIRLKKAKKLILPDYLASVTSALTMGFSLIYWEYATRFEVFALNNVFAILILILSARIAIDFKKSGEISPRQLIPYGLLWGLAFGHHQTIVLMAPSAAVLLWDLIKDIYKKKLAYKREAAISFTSFLGGISVFFILILGISAGKPHLDNSGITGFKTAFQALMRSEYGTFTASLTQAGEPSIRTYPYDQIEFYIKNALSDFSVFIFAFLFLGIFNLFKSSKQIFAFSLTGVSVAGFLFLSFAGFGLASSFGQATVRRFFMLPNIFIAILIGFGFEYVFTWLAEIKKKSNYKLGINLAYIYLAALFLLPVYSNYKYADNSKNNLTEFYIEKAYSPMPEEAIFMYSGDYTVMSADYFRYVLQKKPDRIFFSPGRFFSDWYIPHLLKKHPDLDIPIPKTDTRFTSVSQLAEANYEKGDIYINSELSSKDPGLETDFTLYPKHFLFSVKKKGEDIKVEDWKAENEELFNSIDMELLRKIEGRKPGHEMDIIFFLSQHFFSSGHVYDEVGMYEEAITEYERALQIQPAFREAYAALGLIYGEKLATPDYQAAMQYLLTYRSLLVPGEEAVFIEAEKKLSEYNKKLEEIIKEQEEAEKQENESEEEEVEEATESGDLEVKNEK